MANTVTEHEPLVDKRFCVGTFMLGRCLLASHSLPRLRLGKFNKLGRCLVVASVWQDSLQTNWVPHVNN